MLGVLNNEFPNITKKTDQLMERPLEKHLDEIMAKANVTGVLCADSHGLCMGARGPIKPIDAGIITNLAQVAQKLGKNEKEAPVVCLETDVGNIFIRKHEDATVAVYRTPQTQ